MFTVNLEKELLEQNALNDQELLMLKEAQRVLHQQEDADLEALSRSGLGKNLLKADLDDNYRQKTKEGIINKGLDGDRVFTRNQIRSLCLKYKLRFLPTKQYRGALDAQVGLKIREFESKYKGRETRYMICAPTNAFELEKKPKDPLLFAIIGNDQYYLVHKWGNDLSVFRRVLGLLAKTRTQVGLLLTFIASLTIILHPYIEEGFTGYFMGFLLSMLILLIGCLIIGLTLLSLGIDPDDKDLFSDWSVKWDSKY